MTINLGRSCCTHNKITFLNVRGISTVCYFTTTSRGVFKKVMGKGAALKKINNSNPIPTLNEKMLDLSVRGHTWRSSGLAKGQSEACVGRRRSSCHATPSPPLPLAAAKLTKTTKLTKAQSHNKSTANESRPAFFSNPPPRCKGTQK